MLFNNPIYPFYWPISNFRINYSPLGVIILDDMPLRIVILNENSDPSPLFIVSEHSSFYTFICLLNEEKELAQKKKKNEKNEGINNNNYS